MYVNRQHRMIINIVVFDDENSLQCEYSFNLMKAKTSIKRIVGNIMMEEINTCVSARKFRLKFPVVLQPKRMQFKLIVFPSPQLLVY